MDCISARKRRSETSKESSPSQDQVKAKDCRLTWNGKVEAGTVARARARKRISVTPALTLLSRGLTPFAPGGEETGRRLFLNTSL